MNQESKTKNQGFTLIELIIYISIVTVMMTTLIPFAWNIIEGGAKSATEQEIFSNARFVSERIKYEIRNATGINSVTGMYISLATANPTTNPTIIDFAAGNIRIKEGAGSPVNLNSQNATISALTFTSYTSGDNKTKNIQFSFTMNASYSGTKRQEYIESTKVESSAELRNN